MQFNSRKNQVPINSDAMSQLHHQLKSAFSTVKEEMDEHLESINDNTTEIQENSDRLVELENKIDKLESRMEEIHLMFRQVINTTKVSIELNLEEQKVFLILYTHDSFLSAEQIADRF